MRLLAAFGVFAVVAIVGALLVALNPTWVYDVNGTALGSSLAHSTDGSGGRCTPMRSDDRWSCGVEVDPGSGIANSYRLTSDDDGCWTARRISARRDQSRDYRELSGCAEFLDYASPDKPGLGVD
jgi:hypothetical protein